jgi:putative transposase
MNVRQQIWGMEPSVAKKRRPRRSRPRPRLGDPLAMQARSRVRVALPSQGEQLSFADQRTWGGPRPDSGRKVQSVRRKVPHRVRAAHASYHPVHVTMRRAKGLPGFRAERLHRLLREAIRETRREGFRIVHYSIQSDHLHMLVEADDARALTNGMKSFAVRVAMRVNHWVLRRPRGRVWGDSYHRRELTSPSEVRNVLVYLLNNHLKHGEWEVGLIDPCSSAPWFGGWMHRREPVPKDEHAGERAWTWLLDEGWSTTGLGWLHVGEVPRALWH